MILFFADTASVKTLSAAVILPQSRGNRAMPTCDSVSGKNSVGRTNDGRWDVYEINGRHYAKVVVPGQVQRCFLRPVANDKWTRNP